MALGEDIHGTSEECQLAARLNVRDSIHCAGKSLETRWPAAVTRHEEDSGAKLLVCQRYRFWKRSVSW